MLRTPIIENMQYHLSSELPPYDEHPNSVSSSIAVVQVLLSLIKLTQGAKVERLEAKKLLDHLIKEYPAPPSDESIEFVRKPGETDNQWLERFILEVNRPNSELKFLEVNNRNKLRQPGHFLTHFHDK